MWDSVSDNANVRMMQSKSMSSWGKKQENQNRDNDTWMKVSMELGGGERLSDSKMCIYAQVICDSADSSRGSLSRRAGKSVWKS